MTESGGGYRRRAFDETEVKRLATEIRNELIDELEKRTSRIVETAQETMLGKLGLVLKDAESIDRLRANLAWVTNRRAFEMQIIRQGVGAVILALIGGIFTAVWFYISGGRVR